MDQLTLSAKQRSESGSRPARRMRREGLVPAVVYGRDVDTIPVAVSGRELYRVLHTEAGGNAILTVEVDNGDSVLAVAREIQRDPVRGDITHLDLIKVFLDEAIQAEVLIEFLGTPAGVRDDEGIVETIATSVLIEALPTAIPASVPLDISALGIGDSLKLADLPAVEGVTYLEEPDRPLVTVLAPRLIEEVVVDEELEEGEEGEEGEDAEADEDEES